jgi:hypothetical protein
LPAWSGRGRGGCNAVGRSGTGSRAHSRDTDLELRALAQLGFAEVAVGRVDDGLAHLDESIAAATSGEPTSLENLRRRLLHVDARVRARGRYRPASAVESCPRLIEEDSSVFLRSTLTGTHDGEYKGIPATGRHVAAEAAEVFRIQDGKFVGYWRMTTVASLMRQLTEEPAHDAVATPAG